MKSRGMQVQELLELIVGKAVPPVSVVFGDEPWFKDAVVRATRNVFLAGDEEGFLSLDAPRSIADREGVSLSSAVDELRTVPMFATKKVVAYRTKSLDKSEVALLCELAAHSPSFGKLIVCCLSLSADAVKALRTAGATVAESRRLYDTPFPGKPAWTAPLNQFVVKRAAARRKRMDAQTSLALTELVGNDLGAIDAAIEKLAMAAGDLPVIEEAQVRALVGGTREYDAFAFGEAIYNRDAEGAFRIQHAAFVEGMDDVNGSRNRSAGFVAGRLLWSVRYQLKGVYAAAVLLAAGRSPAAAAKGLSRHPRVAARLVGQARSFKVPELRRHHLRVVQAEADLRSSLPESVVVGALIADLTGSARGGGRG